jgi:hypothetical protein
MFYSWPSLLREEKNAGLGRMQTGKTSVNNEGFKDS